MSSTLFAALVLAGACTQSRAPDRTAASAEPAANESPPVALIAKAATAPAIRPKLSNAVVQSVVAEAHVTSPLKVDGVAPNDWYFEAVFPVRLETEEGAYIGEALAQAQSDWTTPGPVKFEATLGFIVEEETPAVIVLQEDTPGEAASGEEVEPRAVRIPVTLLPASS
ncbi:MAG: Gmad2 immunoglobulin-like domain-containing protein [Hyphomonadaceae bacterium]